MVSSPSAPRAPSIIDDEALGRLGIAVQRLSRRFRTASASHGLSPSAMSVLSGVVRLGPVAIADLAIAEAIHPTMLSRTIAALEREGLVNRAQDAKDRRCYVISATPRARRMQDRIRAERVATLRGALSELDARDTSALLAALPALERLGGARG